MNRILQLLVFLFIVFQLNLFADSNITTQSVVTIIEEVNSVDDVEVKAFVLSHELGLYFKKYNIYFTLGGFDSARFFLFLLVIIIAFLTRKVIIVLFEFILNAFFSVTDKNKKFSDHKDLMHKTFQSAKMPFLWFYIVFCVRWAFKILYFPEDLPDKLELVFNISHLITITWFLLSFFSQFESVLLRYIRKGKSNMPEENISFIILSIKILIIVISFLFLINILIPDIQNSFIFSSISLGIAAFFLKDQANTYSATFKIIFHHKMKVGAWMYGFYQGKEFSGDVVKIGLTHIHIRDFEAGLLMFSNDVFIKSYIGTYSDRKVRRVKFDFFIPISTDDSIVNKIIVDLRDYIENHNDVSKDLKYHEDGNDKNIIEREIGASETRLVNLVDMMNGYKVNVYCYVNQNNWKAQLLLREDIMLKSASIAKKYGVRIAIEGKYIQAQPMDNSDDKLVVLDNSSETKK